MSASISSLSQCLASVPPGSITDTGKLIELLYKCWSEFEGSTEHRMSADKLGRMEDVKWQPPKLTFTIERHGAMTGGSSRAELQKWIVDIHEQRAHVGTTAYRQIYLHEKALRVEPLVERAVKAVGTLDSTDPCIKELPDGRVRVLVGKLVPADNVVKQTLAGRRKRFRKALEARLSEIGWVPVSDRAPYTYGRRQQDG